MLNINALRAELVRNGYTYPAISKELGISARTFSSRMKSGNFTREEIEILIEKLHIANISSIFFDK